MGLTPPTAVVTAAHIACPRTTRTLLSVTNEAVRPFTGLSDGSARATVRPCRTIEGLVAERLRTTMTRSPCMIQR
jgi:hypothetical protein